MNIGIDIGGTEIKSVCLSTEKEILFESKTPSGANIEPKIVLDNIKTCIENYLSKNISISKIGVGCAGSVDSTLGIVRNSPNFNHFKNIHIKSFCEETFSIPTKVYNDANCALFTEYKLGHAKDKKNVVLLTFGTGIGGALLLNGNLYEGSTGTAGELGHLSIVSNGIACNCGHSGCFERYCSATAIKQKLPKEISLEHFFANPNSFPEIYSEFIANLTNALISIANIFDPDVILFGGALSNGFKNLLPFVLETVKRKCFPSIANNLDLAFCKYSTFSGAIGAALIAETQD